MNRLKKFYYRAIQKSVRPGSKIYYFAEKHLYQLRAVVILPVWVHRTVFSLGMFMVTHNMPKLGDNLIHKVPLSVRFLIP